MADLAKLVDELSGLSLLEAAELTKMLEEKWGVSAAAPMAMMAAGPAAVQRLRKRKKRPSLTSSSPISAPRRSRSSRRSAP